MHTLSRSLFALAALGLVTALSVTHTSAQTGGAIVQETPGTPAPATEATPAPAATEPAAAPVAQPVTDTPAAPRPETPAPAPAANKPKPKPVVREQASAPVATTASGTPIVPVLINQPLPAKRFGDGVSYVGHRYFEEKGGGWGWIKKDGDSWGSAKWVALQEDPIGGILMPSRKMGGRGADQDYEYKFTGYFSQKEAYDPHLDETMPIFVIESYQSLGPAKSLDRKPGPPMRFTRSKRSRSSSRDDRPIIQHPDSDSF